MIFGKYLGFHALPTEFHEMIDEKYLVSKKHLCRLHRARLGEVRVDVAVEAALRPGGGTRRTNTWGGTKPRYNQLMKIGGCAVWPVFCLHNVINVLRNYPATSREIFVTS